MKTLHFNGLTEAQAERLAVLIEECSEVQKAACKILRHGYESHNPDGMKAITNRMDLACELGDLQAAIQRMLRHTDFSVKLRDARWEHKMKFSDKYMHHQTPPQSEEVKS